MRPVKKTSVLSIVLLFLLVTGSLSACGSGNKDKNEKTKKITIGIVNFVSALDNLVDSYKLAMGEIGYTEGENITYIYNGAVNSIEGLDAEVQKLVDAKVDLILSVSTPATQAAKRVTEGTDIPVIFFPVTDPIGAGVVENISQPGGNLTGIMVGHSGSKQLEWLKTTVPDIQRVYMPYNSDDPAPSSAVILVSEDAKNLGIEPVLVETPNGEAILAALDNMPEDIDAILLIPDSLLGDYMADIVAFSLEHKIPLAASNKDYAEMGALIGFGGDQYELGRQAARITQQVLKGIPAGELPVESVEYYLTVNLVTASAIGVDVPDTVVRSAKDVIRE